MTAQTDRRERVVTYDEAENFHDRYTAGAERLLGAFYERKAGERFAWPVVKAARIARIWLDFGRSGVVRDEKGMQAITDRILDNIAMLRASTELMGHSQLDPREVAEMAGYDLTDEDEEALGDYLVHSDGSWLLSDYGLPHLEKLYGPLFNATTAEEQLYAVDRILNVVHQRSDLASLFIEGGTATLLRISTQN